ncbi:MAG: hypothetical protein ACKOPO_10600 [Novosphingobium sp.]
MADATRILGDPEWLAHRFVGSDDAFRFIRVARADHAQVPFLTDDHLGNRECAGDIPAGACLAELAEPPLHFLFHSAFCGSTMLVRALSQPGVAMGLSEPQVLNDVVGFRRRGADPRAVARAADGATRLIGRPFAAGEAVIVKPSNVINPLTHVLMALRPSSRAVFLHVPLETFLVSVANKGMHCRIWARELLQGYLLEGAVEGMGFTRDDLFRQSDLQVAAVGWLVQHRLFAALAAKTGDRMASLDGDLMFADMANALLAVATHYGLSLDVEAAMGGRAVARHSKSGDAYSAQTRADDYARVRAAHGDEIDMVLAWSQAVAGAAGISLTAAKPLLQA